MRLQTTSFILLFATSGLRGLAQETSGELDPVTITASVSPTQSSKTGRNIIVIKGDQFAKLPINSVDELLKYVPGIEVQARGPMGSQSDIVIRGGTFQQVLVILDGIRLNDPLTGHFNSYMPIAPGEIDRIEVLKGASSAIYGAEAVGGVIHIITKTFAQSAKKNTVSAQINAGEYGLLTGQASGVFTDGKNTISGGVLTNNADGQPQRGTNGYFNNTTASISYARKLNDHWNLALRTAYDDRDFSAQNFYTTFKSDTAKERVKTWWNHAMVSYSNGKLKWNTNVGYKTAKDHYLFNDYSTANENKSSMFQALSTVDISLSSNSSITTGVQFINQGIISNDRGDHTVNQGGAFAILHQAIGSKLFLDPAIRLDYNQLGGFEFVPQLNASFRGDIYQIRGSIGRTIRNADFTERFNNYNKPLVLGGSIGNPDLVAETSISYELGGDLRLGNHFKISATWFQRHHDNLIDYITTPYSEMPRKDNLVPNGIYALAKNFSSLKTTGYETDLQFQQPISTNQQLTATAGLTWLDSKLNNGETPGFYLSSHAKFLTNFSVIYHYKWLSLSLNGIYKTRQEQEATAINAYLSKDYFLVNAKVDVLLGKHVSVFMQVDNVGDVKYSDLLGAQMPGRWLMGGFKANF